MAIVEHRINGANGAAESWTVKAVGDGVEITHCKGAFGLPVAQMTIAGACAQSVAKAISAQGKRTAPSRGESRGND